MHTIQFASNHRNTLSGKPWQTYQSQSYRYENDISGLRITM